MQIRMNEAILHGDLDGTAREALHAKVADEVANMPDLGNVGHATHADSADNATHADSADNATHADTADNATHADSADNATHADSADNATHADTADNATHADTADNATHATSADTATNAVNATNATNAVTAQTATSANTAKTATTAKTANNALALGGKTLADVLASGATKAVKLEENSTTGAFRYDLGNGLIMVVFNETLRAGANTPSNCSIQVAEFPNKILFAIPTIVDSTAHAAFVGYDIMGKNTIKLWVGSTPDAMSSNRSFKVRCVVIGY